MSEQGRMHWWLFLMVVPVLVAIDHAVRWIAEESVVHSTATLGLAPLTRKETWISMLFPPSGILRTLFSFVAVGLSLYCYARAVREGWLTRAGVLMLSAGALGNWFDQVLFHVATVPIRLQLPLGGGAFAFSMGDGYLMAGLGLFALASARARTSRQRRQQSDDFTKKTTSSS